MFSNSIVALVTPFRNNNVDLESLERIINFQIEGGTDSILVCGSTGEGLLIDNNERELIINSSKEIINKRVTLIVGASSPSTRESIFFANQAEKLKVDGILSIVPYYVKPTQNGIIKHFAEIHENSNIPIILYNNPGRCAVNMSTQTIITLAKQYSRIVALKDSDTYLGRISHIKEHIPNFKLLSGDDMSSLGYLSSGGDGVISVVSNVAPKMIKNMINAVQNNDLQTAQNINMKITQLAESMFIESNPIPVKYAMYKKNLIQNELRLPLTIALEKTQKIVDEIMNKWDFI